MKKELYLMYTKSAYSARKYVFGISEGDYKPKLTEDPTLAQRLDRQTCRKVDESTALFLQTAFWTPALQEMIEENYRPEKSIMHYSTSLSIDDDSARTACGHVIHRDSITDKFSEVTCDTCIRRAHGSKVTGKDLPRGYWPIRGKYFGQDIRTLPASYWCWIIDNTNLVKEGSYLHEYFMKNEKTFRRRSKLKI